MQVFTKSEQKHSVLQLHSSKQDDQYDEKLESTCNTLQYPTVQLSLKPVKLKRKRTLTTEKDC